MLSMTRFLMLPTCCRNVSLLTKKFVEPLSMAALQSGLIETGRKVNVDNKHAS